MTDKQFDILAERTESKGREADIASNSKGKLLSMLIMKFRTPEWSD